MKCKLSGTDCVGVATGILKRLAESANPRLRARAGHEGRGECLSESRRLKPTGRSAERVGGKRYPEGSARTSPSSKPDQAVAS